MDHFEECQAERRAVRMYEMLRRFNVDVKALAKLDEGRTFLAARQRCLNCEGVGECLAWLDGRRSGEDASEFCSNADLFASLRKAPCNDYQI
jgi:hypothetical protein